LQAAGASELVSDGISSLRGEFNSQEDEWEKKASSHWQHRSWSTLLEVNLASGWVEGKEGPTPMRWSTEIEH
jgi:hypothetical protein